MTSSEVTSGAAVAGTCVLRGVAAVADGEVRLILFVVGSTILVESCPVVNLVELVVRSPCVVRCGSSLDSVLGSSVADVIALVVCDVIGVMTSHARASWCREKLAALRTLALTTGEQVPPLWCSRIHTNNLARDLQSIEKKFTH